MNNFTFQLPTKIHFGKETQHMAGALAAQYGKRILLHYGGGSIKKSGLYDQVVDSLKKEGCKVFELGGVVPNPHLSLCRKGIELCRKEKIDLILAVGGGSVIDSAKCIAQGTLYDGDVWDYFVGKQKDVGEVLPVGAILTLPASGSENNGGMVITNEDGNLKYGYGNDKLYPKFAILNPEVTYTLPAYQTAAGAVDTIAHVLGSYTTNQWDNELIHSMVEATIKTVIKYAPIAIKEPENYEARAQLMWAATIGCNSSLAVGCESDGTSHVIQHEFGALYDITHGAGLAIVLLGWFKYIVNDCPARFARFAEHVFGVEYDYANPLATAQEGIKRLEQFFESLKMPTRFSQVNIDDSRFEEIAKRIKDFFGLYGNIKMFDVKDTMNILNLCK